MTRYLSRTVIYSVVTIALIAVCRSYLMPLLLQWLGDGSLGRLACAAGTITITGPFIASIIMPSIKRSEHERLVEMAGTVSYVPIVVMFIISAILSTIFLAAILQGIYPSAVPSSRSRYCSCWPSSVPVAAFPNPVQRAVWPVSRNASSATSMSGRIAAPAMRTTW